MRTPKDYPDFSAIRSPLERAEARRGYELGLQIGEALARLNGWLGRLTASMSRRASAPRDLPTSLPTWE